MKNLTKFVLASQKAPLETKAVLEETKKPVQPESNLWQWQFGYILASYLIVFIVLIRVGAFWTEKARNLESRLKELGPQK